MFQDLTPFYWVAVAVIAVVAIYYTWGRKKVVAEEK
jgi:hypothetical protein